MIPPSELIDEYHILRLRDCVWVAGVGGYSAAANALYRSVFGDDHELYEPWVKQW